MEQPIDKLLCARWVIPVEPDNTVYDNHAVAIHNGQIIDVLPADVARQRYQAKQTLHFDDHVLMPGLVNSHTHASMSLFRGLADDLPLMDWLNNHIWPAEAQWASPEFVLDGTRLAMAEMIRSGTTCFNDMYFFPDQTALAAAEAGLRACVGLIVIDFPTAWAHDPDEYFHKGITVHDNYRSHPLIHTAFAPHAPYTVSDKPLEHIAMLVEELDIPVHMHIHETEHEVEDAKNEHQKRPLERLKDLGIVSPRLMAVHMTTLTEQEIEMCASYNAHIVHCPQSNLKLASGFCPVQQLLDAGINVALGTDGAASNNDLDMLAEMQSAAMLAKAVAGDATALPAHSALRMATYGGAKALGLEQIIGSLETGKSADLIAVDLSRPETQPIYDPISQIVYAAGREQVTDVWVAGKQLMKQRHLQTLDSDSIIENCQEWSRKIKPSL